MNRHNETYKILIWQHADGATNKGAKIGNLNQMYNNNSIQ